MHCVVATWSLDWWADALLIFPALWTASQVVLSEIAAIRAAARAKTLTPKERETLNSAQLTDAEWELQPQAVHRVRSLRATAQNRLRFSALLPRPVLWLMALGLVLQAVTLLC